MGDTQPLTGGHLLFLSSGDAIPGVDESDFALSSGTCKTSVVEFVTCLPAGTSTMTIVWRMYSEEFQQWCGGVHQDYVLAKLRFSNGEEMTVLERSIDDLCPPESCPGCGEHYQGLEMSTVYGGQDGMWHTPWVTTEVPVEVLEQSSLTIHVEVGDDGDSIYDSAFVIDRIVFSE